MFLATSGTVGERGIALQGSEGTATLTTPGSMSKSQLRPPPTHNPTQAGNLRAVSPGAHSDLGYFFRQDLGIYKKNKKT